ncbi:hypothetical protein EDB19DRAFT_1838615 [Suillus lakei]|nr:hypothetical protein EDB19DRAFT_1838615 [Suillus lakei]
MLPKRTTQPTEKVLAMAAEGQAKRKAAEKAPDATPASKRPKTMASTGPANNPSSTRSIYQATVRTEEEEEAAHQDAETIILDSDVDNQAPESSNEDPSESSDAELTRLMKDWSSPIYAFFEPTPAIEYHDK